MFQKMTGECSRNLRNRLTSETLSLVVMYSAGNVPLQLDISDFVCTLTRIKVARMTLGHTNETPKVSFDLGADIKEIETVKGRLRLKYTLYLDANPAVERAELGGEVTITSDRISSVTDLQALGEEKISEIAMQIYRRNFETLYLLFESSGLQAPSPWLIEDVRLVPGEIQPEVECPATPPAAGDRSSRPVREWFKLIRRSKLEVLMDIMKVVAEEREAKRTRIMYKANLAWNVLKECLDSMESKGMLTSKDTPSGLVVQATEDGLNLLNKYCAVESVFMEPTAAAEGMMYPTARMTVLH